MLQKLSTIFKIVSQLQTNAALKSVRSERDIRKKITLREKIPAFGNFRGISIVFSNCIMKSRFQKRRIWKRYSRKVVSPKEEIPSGTYQELHFQLDNEVTRPSVPLTLHLMINCEYGWCGVRESANIYLLETHHCTITKGFDLIAFPSK